MGKRGFCQEMQGTWRVARARIIERIGDMTTSVGGIPKMASVQFWEDGRKECSARRRMYSWQI